MSGQCERCSTPLPEPANPRHPGRPRKYCSKECLYAAHRKRSSGPRGDGATMALYFAYCTGLSIKEVAELNGRSYSTVNNRFRRLGLPLRKNINRCQCRNRNPHRVQGVPFDLHNVTKARVAAAKNMPQYEAALAAVSNPRMKEVLTLRVKHPQASVAELGEMVSPPVSKDVVYSLLRRAVAQAVAS